MSFLIPRVGIGVDVHAFETSGTHTLMLGGIEFPGERALAGHSDADVICHAVSDAVLSAAGLGDLGSQIGTDDPHWAGAAGLAIVAEMARRVGDRGLTIVNASVQLIGNRPRLGPVRARAQMLVSGALGAPVSISATSTDGLGFLGRGEGLGAIAVAMVVGGESDIDNKKDISGESDNTDVG